MTTLKYNSSQIRTAANSIRTENENIKTNMTKLDQLCTNVQSSWKDSSTSKYIQKVEEKKASIAAMVEQLDNLATILDKCANSIDANRQSAIENGGNL